MAHEYQHIYNGEGSKQIIDNPIDIDSDSVWDELSHHQSREIQQHQHRTASTSPESSVNTLPNTCYHNYGLQNSKSVHHYYCNSTGGTGNCASIRQGIQQTAAALSSAASIAKDGVITAAASASTAVRDGFAKNTMIGAAGGRRGRGVGTPGIWGDNHKLGFGLRDNVDRSRPGDGVLYEYRGPYSNPHQTRQYQDNHVAGREESPVLPLAEFGLQHSSSSPSIIMEGGMESSQSSCPSNNINVHGRHMYSSDMGASLLDRDEFNGDRSASREDTNNEKNFILLNQFRLRPKRDGWGMVANLDLYFTSLYNYYYHQGLTPIIGKGITELITLFFTLCFSVFLLAYLDWPKLFHCTDEDTCEANLQRYIIDRPFRRVSLWNFVIIIYIVLFSAYGIFSTVSFVSTVRRAFESKYIFEDKLGISVRKLEGGAVEWHEVVRGLLNLQKNKSYRVAQNDQDIKDELVIAQRIMRRENFMIAFFNRNMLDLTIPSPSLFRFCSEKVFYSKSLEWGIYICILSYMFNHKYQIRSAFYTDAASLRRRFILCGIVHAVFIPFLLFFMTLHFFMQNVYDFRSSQQYLGPRDWSDVAKWKFREFNELPHVFERRLGPSYEAAEKYVHLFGPSSLMNAAGRILVFLSGSIIGVLLVLAAINDAILLHVKLGNWNLLWYVGVLGVTFSVGKGMRPDPKFIPRYHHNLFSEMDAALAEVSSHTHHYPDFWKKRGWDDLIKRAFCELYQYKAKLFFTEILSVIVAPVVLCFSLPNCAEDICCFVQKIKVEVPGAGDHCGYSTFDFDLCKDESWEGQQIGVDIRSTQGAGDNHWKTCVRSGGDAILSSLSRPKALEGKMEKSFFNFKSVHPEWKCSSSGQDLIDRIESYQTQQAIALARERRHYVEAATRQLEALHKVDEKTIQIPNSIQTIEKYIVPKEAVVDTDKGCGRNGQETASNESRSDLSSSEKKIETHSVLHSHFSENGDENFSRPLPNNAGLTRPSSMNMIPESSVMHYTDIGLSTELQRVLNRSTFDLEASSACNILGPNDSLLLSQLNRSVARDSFHVGDDDELIRGRELQKQYMWLERYHASNKLSNDSSGIIPS